MARKLTILALFAATAGCVRVEKPALVASHGGEQAAPSEAIVTPVTFTGQIQPIVARCQPCHFPGGKMYARLPFDRPQTIRLLGEKLFTRIQDEGERQLIREFLKQAPGGSGP
jgi:hypothetical protein